MFEVNLHRTQDAAIWRSEGAEVNPLAAKLQDLFDRNVDDGKGYAKELEKLKQDGHNFRLTEGRVFELFPSEERMQVPIRLQVKEGVITWYFETPPDITHQTFRDEVYRSAALAHMKVDHACEKYLRGTNALHVKKMHTSEDEAGMNHNHYRLLEGHDVTPKDLRQHLMGFVKAQREQNLLAEDGKTEKFLDEKEAEEILQKFEAHWTSITHKGAAKKVEIAGKTIELPAREKSLLEEYKANELSKWDEKDWKEWNKYKDLEQPCKTIDPTLPLEQRIAAAEKGMRGIRAEAAHRRQVPGSKFKVLKTRFKKDDAVVTPPEQKQNKTGKT